MVTPTLQHGAFDDVCDLVCGYSLGYTRFCNLVPTACGEDISRGDVALPLGDVADRPPEIAQQLVAVGERRLDVSSELCGVAVVELVEYSLEQRVEFSLQVGEIVGREVCL